MHERVCNGARTNLRITCVVGSLGTSLSRGTAGASMNIELARSLFTALAQDVSLFGYCGKFPDEHSPKLIELGELLKRNKGENGGGKGRPGYVMVEAFQNIIRHRAQLPLDHAWSGFRSMFVLRTRPQGHVLTTCNPVTHGQARRLEQLLGDLRGKDASELKELYLEGLERRQPPGRRGAGLGLIEMVRRSGGTPRWQLAPMGGAHELFSFILEMGGAVAAQEAECVLDGPLQLMVQQHEVMLFRVGPWTADVGKLLTTLAQAEVAARPGRTANRDAVWGLCASMVMPLLDDRPVLFVLHGHDSPMLSVGGAMSQADAGGLHAAMLNTDVQLSFGEMPGQAAVLGMVHVPW